MDGVYGGTSANGSPTVVVIRPPLVENAFEKPHESERAEAPGKSSKKERGTKNRGRFFSAKKFSKKRDG